MNKDRNKVISVDVGVQESGQQPTRPFHDHSAQGIPAPLFLSAKRKDGVADILERLGQDGRIGNLHIHEKPDWGIGRGSQCQEQRLDSRRLMVIDIDERFVLRDVGEPDGLGPRTNRKIFQNAEAVPVRETEHLLFLTP